MTRDEKIADIRSALTDEQRQWLAFLIETAIIEPPQYNTQGAIQRIPYAAVSCLLHMLAQEFRDGQD
jgi:hypothetical protein